MHHLVDDDRTSSGSFERKRCLATRIHAAHCPHWRTAETAAIANLEGVTTVQSGLMAVDVAAVEDTCRREGLFVARPSKSPMATKGEIDKAHVCRSRPRNL